MCRYQRMISSMYMHVNMYKLELVKPLFRRIEYSSHRMLYGCLCQQHVVDNEWTCTISIRCLQ